MGFINLIIIFALVGLVIGSLLFCRRVSEHQINSKLNKIRLAALDRRIARTWAVVEAMEIFTDYPQVIKTLCQSLRIDMDRLFKLDSNFPEIKASQIRLQRKEEGLDNALVEINKLKESRRVNPASEEQSRLAEVDRLIEATTFENKRDRTQTRLYIESSKKIIHRLHKYRKIDRRKFSSIKLCLKVMDLFIEVNFCLSSAELALGNSDMVSALAFYRRAHDGLNGSSVPAEEKSHRLKSVESLIDDLLKEMSDDFKSKNEPEDTLSDFERELETLNERYIYDMD